MKLTLITILLGFGMSAASFAADAFRVYALCSKAQTDLLDSLTQPDAKTGG